MNLLTNAEIGVVRRRYIGDLCDTHPEFGMNPVVAANASAGDALIQIEDLGQGTIYKGTVFNVIHSSGRRDRYSVIAEVTIAANAADVYVSPSVLIDTAKNSLVEVEAYYKSLYNTRTRENYFSDAEILEMAQNATENYGTLISNAANPKEALFRGIRYLALQEMLSIGSKYMNAMLADDLRGSNKIMIDQLEMLYKEDRAYFNRKFTSAFTFPVVR